MAYLLLTEVTIPPLPHWCDETNPLRGDLPDVALVGQDVAELTRVGTDQPFDVREGLAEERRVVLGARRPARVPGPRNRSG